MSCNCNDPSNPNTPSCGCDPQCTGPHCNSVTELEQLVNDAIAAEKPKLEQLAADAEDSANKAKGSADDAAKSALEAKGYRDSAETAASSATGSLKVITDTAIILEETGKVVKDAADEVLTAIAGISVRNWYYTTVQDDQKTIVVPSNMSALAVQNLYIHGSRQDLNYGYTFDKPTMTITLAEGLPKGVRVTVVLGVYNTDPANNFAQTLASNNGASLVGTTGGKTVQQEIDTLKQASGNFGDALNPVWQRMAAESGLTLQGSFETGLNVTAATDAVVFKAQGKLYKWGGTLPKTVAANSTPATSGGIAANAWIQVDQATLREQLADTGGSALIGSKLSLTGSVKRALSERLGDYVSVLDFGADPTGTIPSTQAFQNALDACSNKAGIYAHGRKLYAPSGRYTIDGNLVYSWRATATAKTDADNDRVVLVGDGDGNTFVDDIRTAPGATPLLTVDGGTTDPHLRFSLHGIRFQRPKYDRLGWGLLFRNISIMDICNCSINWFGTGVVIRDCIQVKIDHTQIGANLKGLDAGRDTWTNPNVFDLRHVMFSANNAGAVTISNGTNVKFDTCSFEGNGSDQAAHNTLQYDGGTDEGGLGMMVVNCYFENNQVLADINIGGSTDKKVTFIIEGNSMQRTSPTRYCKSHILFNQLNPQGKHRVHLRGNTFKFLGGYTHQAGDSSVTARSAFTEVIEEGNIYQPQQLPEYAATVAVGYNNSVIAAAKVTVAGTPAVVSGFNAASVTRTATGMYKIMLKKELSSANVIPVATAENVTGNAHIYGYDTTSVTVYTTDPAGTASDAVPFNMIAVGIML